MSRLSKNLYPNPLKCMCMDVRMVEDSALDSKSSKIIPPKREWERTDYFQESWIKFISKIPSHIFRRDWIINKPEWKKWLEIKPNHEHLEKTQFRCRICHKYYDKYMEGRF